MGYLRRPDLAPLPSGPDPDEVVLWLGPVAINADVPMLPAFDEELPINGDVAVQTYMSAESPDSLQTP